MATKALTAPADGPLPVKIQAGYLDLTVAVSATASRQAVLTLDGDQKTLDEISGSMRGDAWSIKIPNEGGGSINVSTGSVVIGDGSFQSVSFGRRGRSVVSGGSVFMSGGRIGRTIINNVDVTDYVREHQGEAGTSEVKGTLTLPAGSTLEASIDDGSVQLGGGTLQALIETRNANVTSALGLLTGSVKVHNGDVDVDASGALMAESHNGDVCLNAVAGQTNAVSHNGKVRVHAVDSVQIMATSHNGNVKVTKAAGTSPQVMASSRNGRVSKP
jgi:hypothetical protein